MLTGQSGVRSYRNETDYHENCGTMVSVLALSYSGLLFAGSMLRVEDQAAFRRTAREVAMSVPASFWHQGSRAWQPTGRAVLNAFVPRYRDVAVPSDLAAFQYWARNWWSSLRQIDPIGAMWMDVLHLPLHMNQRHRPADLSVEDHQTFNDFGRAFDERWNDDEWLDTLETIREHRDTDADLELRMHLHLDLDDGILEPLDYFHKMRGKHILLAMLAERRDDTSLTYALDRMAADWINKEIAKDPSGDRFGYEALAPISIRKLER